MARNPYDRRGPRDPRDFRSMVGVGSMVSAEFSSTPPALMLDELIAIGRSAYSRGRRDEARDIDDRVRDAQREAWDEGHAEGREDGRSALTSQLDEQFGAHLRALSEAGHGLMTAFRREPRKATKGALDEQLGDVLLLLDSLINAHHRGFPPGTVEFVRGDGLVDAEIDAEIHEG